MANHCGGASIDRENNINIINNILIQPGAIPEGSLQPSEQAISMAPISMALLPDASAPVFSAAELGLEDPGLSLGCFNLDEFIHFAGNECPPPEKTLIAIEEQERSTSALHQKPPPLKLIKPYSVREADKEVGMSTQGSEAVVEPRAAKSRGKSLSSLLLMAESSDTEEDDASPNHDSAYKVMIEAKRRLNQIRARNEKKRAKLEAKLQTHDADLQRMKAEVRRIQIQLGTSSARRKNTAKKIEVLQMQEKEVAILLNEFVNK